MATNLIVSCVPTAALPVSSRGIEYSIPFEEGHKYVVRTPASETEMTWSIVKQGSIVAIPLVPYLLDYDSIDALLFRALTLMLDILPQTDGVPAVRFIIGNGGKPVTINDQSKYRFYLGVVLTND